MKIITGKYGGRRFDVPSKLPARPTTDLAKGALFNILSNRLDFDGLRCLDLFAGTGAITFELLSREAASVTSVEMGRQQIQFIRSVARQLGVGFEWKLIAGDVFKFLRQSPAMPFDFIFADPPYALRELPDLPDIILSGGWLTEDGTFVVEHGQDHDFKTHPRFTDTRSYGAVHFTFFSSQPQPRTAGN